MKNYPNPPVVKPAFLRGGGGGGKKKSNVPFTASSYKVAIGQINVDQVQ